MYIYGLSKSTFFFLNNPGNFKYSKQLLKIKLSNSSPRTALGHLHASRYLSIQLAAVYASASIFHLQGWWCSFPPNSAPWHSYQDPQVKWHSRVDPISHRMVGIRAVTRWSLSLSHAQNPLIGYSLTHSRWTEKPPPPSPRLLAWKSRLGAAWSLLRSPRQRGGGQSRPLPSTRSGAGSILPGPLAAAASQDSGRPQGPARRPGLQRAGCGLSVHTILNKHLCM